MQESQQYGPLQIFHALPTRSVIAFLKAAQAEGLQLAQPASEGDVHVQSVLQDAATLAQAVKVMNTFLYPQRERPSPER